MNISMEREVGSSIESLSTEFTNERFFAGMDTFVSDYQTLGIETLIAVLTFPGLFLGVGVSMSF